MEVADTVDDEIFVQSMNIKKIIEHTPDVEGIGVNLSLLRSIFTSTCFLHDTPLA